MSLYIVSDYLQHDKDAVHKFMEQLLKLSKTKCPEVSVVKMFSDGTASQFKQKFLFSNVYWFQISFELDNFECNFLLQVMARVQSTE